MLRKPPFVLSVVVMLLSCGLPALAADPAARPGPAAGLRASGPGSLEDGAGYLQVPDDVAKATAAKAPRPIPEFPPSRSDIRRRAPAGAASKQAGTTAESLAYSISFPLILQNSEWSTRLGVVNPHAAPAELYLHARSSTGAVLATVHVAALGPSARLYQGVDEIFASLTPEQLAGIGWVEATSDRQLQGFAEFNAADGQQKMFTEAVMSSANRLYIPHIAAEVPEIWWTRASLAAGVGDSNKTLRAGTGAQYPIADLAADGSQAAFDLNAYFLNGLGAGQAVGDFRSSDADMGGAVLFGRSDDVQVASALTLRGRPTRTLYYSHVAQSEVWWTGFTIYNVSSLTAHITVYGYDEAGNLTGQNLVEIAPRVKKVAFVGDFIGPNPIPAYVIMQSDQPVIGFELFGGQSAPIMAGINADSVTSKTLFFNHIQLNEDEWTGVTMINSGADTAHVTVTGYDDSGAQVATGSTTLDPRQKWVRFVQDLFGGTVPSALSHLRVESDQPLSGFVLVGDNALVRLDGLPAVAGEYSDATAVVDASGASLAVGEASATVPAGAIAAGTTVTFSERPLDFRCDAETELAGSACWSLQPDGLQASAPFTLSLPVPTGVTGKRVAASYVIYRWDPGWQSWSALATETGAGVLVAHPTALGVYAVGQARTDPGLSITLTFDIRPGQMMSRGWLIFKRPPQFGLVRELGDASAIYTEKYLPYMQNAARGVIDGDTLAAQYVNNLSQPVVLTNPGLIHAARGQSVWCFFVPTTDSSSVAVCANASTISCWTFAVSEGEYAAAQNKRYRVIILPIFNEETDALGYFGTKIHFNALAIDEPPVLQPATGKDPVLLVPGIQGAADYWGERVRALRSGGFNVYALSHTGWPDIPDTAQMVKAALDYVRGQLPGKKVDLIAHSAGAAIVRYYCLVTEPSTCGSKIDDLVLIGPLHQGSLAAAECALGDPVVIFSRLHLGVTTDPNMPIFRELSPGSPELADLGSRAFPSGVDPLILAGTGIVGGVDDGHVEGTLCEDGLVSVPGASLLGAATPVPLGILALNHLEQPVSEALFGILPAYLVRTGSPGFPVGNSEVVRYLWHAWQDVAEDPGDGLAFNPFAAGLVLDVNSLGGEVAVVELDGDWDTGPAGVPLIENPDNPGIYFYWSAPPDGDTGTVVDLEGAQARTGTLRLQTASGTPGGVLANVPLHASATTNAAPSTPPVIQSFTANPASIVAGESSTLSWNVTSATSVSIDQGIGTVGLSGSRTVNPSVNVTYTLTATNGDISLMAHTIVIVHTEENPGDLWGADSIVGDLYRVQAGSFSQGSPSDEPCREVDEIPFTHTVSQQLAVMATEVTQAMWAALKAVQPSLPSNQSQFPAPQNPVEKVRWMDAVLFANLLSLQQGLNQCYFKDAAFGTPVTSANYMTGEFYCNWNANGYRLPTEGEWEHFTRAGTVTPFSVAEPDYGGDDCATCSPNPALDRLDGVAWWCHNAGYQTRPAGTLNPNPWGLYDVHGNVWEWCWDWYGTYPTSSTTDYRGPASGTNRVLRGGGWFNLAGFCRSAFRSVSLPSERSGDVGFRLVRKL